MPRTSFHLSTLIATFLFLSLALWAFHKDIQTIIVFGLFPTQVCFAAQN